MKSIDKLRLNMKNFSRTATEYKIAVDEVRVLISEYDALDKTISELETKTYNLEKELTKLKMQIQNMGQNTYPVTPSENSPTIVRHLDGGGF